MPEIPHGQLDYAAEARRFFTALQRASPERMRALVDEGRYDVKLSYLTWESQHWVAREHAQRAPVAGLGREKILARMRTSAFMGILREQSRRAYVTPWTRVALPPPRYHVATISERALSVLQANAYFTGLEHPNLKRLDALIQEGRGNQQLWRLLHPRIERTTPAERAAIVASRDRSRSLPRTPPKQGPYRRGQITPVGMSTDRALELAVEAEKRRESERGVREQPDPEPGPAME